MPDPVIVTGNMTLEKNGHVILNNSSSNVGQTYVQKGNWHGKGGILSLGAVLGNDNSKLTYWKLQAMRLVLPMLQ